MEELVGWWYVDFLNNKHKKINIKHAVYDMHGHVMFLVSTDNTYYNMNTITWIKKVEDG